MIYIIIGLLGLCFGSFVNALVWRLYKQSRTSKKSKIKNQKYSILNGRSMCPNCQHELAAKDLLPVLSWLWLKGKCRYCHKPISWQYPLVEAVTAMLFVGSYVFWPLAVHGAQIAVFALWLATLIGLMGLLVYDLRWMLLPNKLIFPLLGLAGIQALIVIVTSGALLHNLIAYVVAVAVGGGLFYLLFQVSGGKWIGGGDVKLGFLLGLLVGSGEKSLLFIFLAAVLGSLVSVPLLAQKKLGVKSSIPFGPFLIIGGIIAVIFGDYIIHWYNHTFLLLG